MTAPAAGPLRFARFAYPPNVLGYCGPGESAALLEHADAGVAGGDLSNLARQFAGAWPYLELIAASCGRADPLDADVVEAYWLGNELLDRVDAGVFAAHLAAGLKAQRLTIVGTTAGVLDSAGATIPQLTGDDIEALTASGTAHSGMVAKLNACRHALDNGVREVAIVAGRGVNDYDEAAGTRMVSTASRV